jgi:hypothetical protein
VLCVGILIVLGLLSVPFHELLIIVQLLSISALQFKLLLRLIPPFVSLIAFGFILLLGLRELIAFHFQLLRFFP